MTSSTPFKGQQPRARLLSHLSLALHFSSLLSYELRKRLALVGSIWEPKFAIKGRSRDEEVEEILYEGKIFEMISYIIAW
jgi:hypothetical protein